VSRREPAPLPTTSVAEFRQAAWPVVDRNMAGSVTLRIYLTWGLLGASLVLLVMGLVGLAQDVPASAGVAAVGAVVLVLTAWRIVSKFRSAARERARVDAQSREIDARAARGEIPVAPAGWQDPVLPPPHERPSSWL
jgi:hypothetical protein